MRRGGGWGWFVFCCIGVAPCMARAQPPPPPPHIGVQLAYLLGPGLEKRCPGEAHLRGEFSADFGYDPIQEDASSRLTIAVTPGPGGILLATMELRDARGTVSWKGHHKAYDCYILLNGVSLSVRIGIDRIAPPRSPPVPAPTEARAAEPEPKAPEPEPEPEPTADPSPARGSKTPAAWTPTRPASPAPSTFPASHMLMDIGFGASFRLGAAPAPSLSLGIQGGLRWSLVSLALEARGDLPTSGEEQFSTSRISGSILPCGHVSVVVGCLVGTVGREHATNEEDDGTAWYAGAGGRLGVEVPLVGPILLRATGEIVATMGENLSVDMDRESQWVAPPIYGAFGAGLAAKW